jgi:predicted AlkP superfamily phosphohydrolase/phosphomutase
VTFGISHRQLQKSLLGLDGIFWKVMKALIWMCHVVSSILENGIWRVLHSIYHTNIFWMDLKTVNY